MTAFKSVTLTTLFAVTATVAAAFGPGVEPGDPDGGGDTTTERNGYECNPFWGCDRQTWEGMNGDYCALVECPEQDGELRQCVENSQATRPCVETKRPNKINGVPTQPFYVCEECEYWTCNGPVNGECDFSNCTTDGPPTGTGPLNIRRRC